MDDRVWTRAADEAPLRRGLGRGLAAIIPARAANATGLLPHLAQRPPAPRRLLTRSALTDRLDEVLAAGRSGGTAVVVLGLDGFRHVNSRVGQEAGDGLLQSLGERLAGGRREGDAVAHLDGDVFALVCPRVDSLEAGDRLIGRLAAAVGRPFEVEGVVEQLGATFGLALAASGETAAGRVLLRRAEMAMLRAKDEGLCWAAYEPKPSGVTSGSGGRPPAATAGAGEPRQCEDRLLRLGR